MESITKIIADFEKRVNDLQRDNEGMKQALLGVQTAKRKKTTLRILESFST
ncbi:hypothetical protein P4W10_16250 [Bacillus thuringiensis]|uniref:hypothetical protein n=1 Tax=Bacillus thuringiensis TaxID=1428 RepID=UPI002DB9A3FC|nr:hypothetical protein [Bacillus thuringiensis]MEC3228219.1 hypothetical protein [Bacillus thuringiensis]MEC3484759.1 hypothetical protein [Bacillus thuringiensis]MED2071764.1 hypothetical protein [Bacillus thuringiensis]MED2213125.1 hypothetical protein [Bacillus thuringiensis]MED2222764.1 hypothetical protein [Bacillus thuringiensis]